MWVVGGAVDRAILEQEPMVYIEPAPPPPPGAGERLLEPSAGSATVEEPAVPPPDPSALVAPRRPEPPQPQPKPKIAAPARTPRPPKAVEAPAAPAGGVPDGVPGGEAGGVAGGIPGGRGTDVVPLALAGRPPVLLAKVTPTYPALARERRIEGVVVVRAVVDGGGRPTRVTVVQSVPLLDEAAIAAFEQWRFTPGRDREGNVVSVLIEVPMRFRLE